MSIFSKTPAINTLVHSKDVVAIEVGLSLPQGSPAVRLRRNGELTELISVGFVDIGRDIPQNTEEADHKTETWTLPKSFLADKAAIAVTSPTATLKQTADTSAHTEARDDHRNVSMVTKKQYPSVVASMPEFQVAWLANRFPEGHKPTVHSIQVSFSANFNCFMTGPVAEAKTTPSMVLFCSEHTTCISAYESNNLILYCTSSMGRKTIKTKIAEKYNTDLSMVDTMLEDPDVDLSNVINPILQTLFKQTSISSDFLERRKSCKIENFFVYGVTSGKRYWSSAFTAMTGQPLHHLHPFGGISHANRKLRLPGAFEQEAPLFTTAVGAAKALLEDL